MAEDYLALLRAADQKKQQERACALAARDAAEALTTEYIDAWKFVFDEFDATHRSANYTPDLSCLIKLAKILKDRGQDVWLPDMAVNIKNSLNDIALYRPAQLYFVHLLILAGKPRATVKQLTAAYHSFTPADPPPFWRVEGAREVYEFVNVRIQAKKEEQRRQKERDVEDATAKRIASLLRAARRRPAIEKQLFAVHWKDHGLGPATIRDKWNSTHASDSIDEGTAGRRDIKTAIRRGREFLAEHATTTVEMATVLNVCFGS